MSSDTSLPFSGELSRKALHILSLAIPVGMWWVGMPAALWVLGPLAAVAVAADVARAYSRTFHALIQQVFGFMMRADELQPSGGRIRFNGATCVLVGAALLALLFPVRLAAPVLGMTMLSDAAAALVGRRWGPHPWPGHSTTVEGTAAFLFTGLTVMAFVPGIRFGPASVGVLGSAVVEALDLPVNDNIRVPLTAAFLIAATETLAYGLPFPLFGGLTG